MRGFGGNKFPNQQGGRGNYNPRGQPGGGGRGGGGGGRFSGNQQPQSNPFQSNQNPPRHPNQSAKPMNNPFASNQGIAMQTQSTQNQGNPFQRSGTQQTQMQVSSNQGRGGRGQGVAAVANNPFARPQTGMVAQNQPFVNQQPFAPAVQTFQQAPPQNAFNPVNMGTSNTPMVSYNFMQPAPAPVPAINSGNPFAVAPVQSQNLPFSPAPPAAPAIPFSGNPFNPNAQPAQPVQGGFMANSARPPVSGPFNNPFAAGGGGGGGGWIGAAPTSLNTPSVTTEQAKAEIKNIDFKSLLQGSSTSIPSDHPSSALKMNSVIMSDTNEDVPPVERHTSEVVEEEKLVGENLPSVDEVEESGTGGGNENSGGGEIDEKLLAWMDQFPFKQFLSNKEELINPFQLLDGGRLTYGRLPAAIP